MGEAGGEAVLPRERRACRLDLRVCEVGVPVVSSFRVHVRVPGAQ